jgi:lysozyme family protein
MAKYEIAEAITGLNEGLYANNKADRGGETYAGIARNFWPKWAGWAIIDQIKNAYGEQSSVINRYAKSNASLHKLISDFYKDNFWDTLNLDDFRDQQIANSVYDFGVNSGTSRAAKFIQEVAGVAADGKIGAKSLSAINGGNARLLHGSFNSAREMFYRSIAKGNQAQFLRSWLSRLTPYNELKMIQYKLGLSPDGVYGPATKSAITNFQKSNGLIPDGIPGDKTSAALYRI